MLDEFEEAQGMYFDEELEENEDYGDFDEDLDEEE